jgi:predicted transcriptional regulator
MGMNAQEVIEQFKALPPQERDKVARFIVEHDDSWVPESFKQGMADIAAGRVVDMETALFETPPPHLR